MAKIDKKKVSILLGLIVIISVIDAFSDGLSNLFPIIGSLLSSLSNGLYEIFQAILVFGVYREVIN